MCECVFSLFFLQSAQKNNKQITKTKNMTTMQIVKFPYVDEHHPGALSVAAVPIDSVEKLQAEFKDKAHVTCDDIQKLVPGAVCTNWSVGMEPLKECEARLLGINTNYVAPYHDAQVGGTVIQACGIPEEEGVLCVWVSDTIV
jgi:hypothetical protein